MATGYKKCPNGHFYKDNLTQCPYCIVKGDETNASKDTTIGYAGGAGAAAVGGDTIINDLENGMMDNGKTQIMSGIGGCMIDSGKTQIMSGAKGFDGETTIQDSGTILREKAPRPQSQQFSANKTLVFDEKAENSVGNGEIRSSRKLVGWLVSYSFSEMGVDFKLFEGRNIIGRDLDCQICVDDNTASAKHAVLLFRSGRYSITDQQSTQGTFVNGEDIELAPRYLNDGDIIKVGQTIFKFRSSL